MKARTLINGGGRAIWAVTALSALGLLLSGCASQGTPEGFVNYQELDDLYRGEVANFPWQLPEGSEFPETIPISDDANATYEANNARAQAFFYWQCSWMNEFFESRYSDPAAAAAALDVIKQSVGNAYKDPFYEDPEGVWDQVVDDAVLGDVAEFKSFYETGCSSL